MALYKKVGLIEQNQYDFWILHIKISLRSVNKPRHQICCRPVIFIYINRKPSKHVKSHVALYKKVDLIEQNQYDFWIQIQHIKIVLDQLKNLDTKFVVDQLTTFISIKKNLNT